MEEILSKLKSIHLVGIGGSGMSSLALLLKDRGFKVRGSDISLNSRVEMLRKEGIDVLIGHEASNLDSGTQLVCYS